MTKTQKRQSIVTGALGAVALLFVLVLPGLLRSLGLHPSFEGQRYLLAEGRALIIATSHSRLGEDGDETGVFGSELTAPYYELQGGRMSVDIASIKGGPIPIDPLSFRRLVRTDVPGTGVTFDWARLAPHEVDFV